MTDAALSSTTERLPGPAVYSVISAPAYYNCAATSVTTKMRLADTIPLKSLMQFDDFVKRRLVENVERAAPELRRILATYLRGYFEQWFTTATIRLPSEMAIANWEPVPTRKFPFASHLNLLALPEVEGALFDPDDLIER